jgi:carbamate kinase
MSARVGGERGRGARPGAAAPAAGPPVLALGGNAIIRSKEHGTIDEQLRNARLTLEPLARLVSGGRQVVVTHGNGPIVGNILIRNEMAKGVIPPMPLHICGADSQGGIGFMLQQVLGNELARLGVARPVVSVVTQVVVDPEDPAFLDSTKPIGPFFSWSDAARLARARGWVMREDSGRGFRRVVPSPEPRAIVEIEAIRTLVDAGAIVIAAGGGGIPVARGPDGTLHGVEAVIDKDRTAALLARALGSPTFVILTEVPEVYVRFGEPDAAPIRAASAAEMERHLAAGEFPEGSMGPKIEAAIRFLEDGGEQVLVTNPESLEAALAGRAGTRITRAGDAVAAPSPARGG